MKIIGLEPLVVSLSSYRLSDVWEDIVRVGQALGRHDQAETLVESYQESDSPHR